MAGILPERTLRFVRALVPEADEVLDRMEAAGRDFPIVGREVGQFLSVLALTADAERIFEFGSGFGYSAYWFGQALPEDGQIVLTEYDADELEQAREFLSRAGLADRAVFEHGDALEVVERYDGPFDVVLVDLDKNSYPDALEAVRGKVPEGGVVVADNAMESGIQDFDAILSILEGDDPGEVNDNTRGIADYLLAVRDDPAFETTAVPLGSGLAVSYKR